MLNDDNNNKDEDDEDNNGDGDDNESDDADHYILLEAYYMQELSFEARPFVQLNIIWEQFLAKWNEKW